jgi:hypothetical protein
VVGKSPLIAHPNLVDHIVLARAHARNLVGPRVEHHVAANWALTTHAVRVIKVVRARLEAVGLARQRAARAEVDDVPLEAGLHRLLVDGPEL